MPFQHEAIQTKSQAVYIFTENKLQKIFKEGKNAGTGAHMWVGTTLKETAVSMCKGTYLFICVDNPGTFAWHLENSNVSFG